MSENLKKYTVTFEMEVMAEDRDQATELAVDLKNELEEQGIVDLQVERVR